MPADDVLDRELAGLDRLELPTATQRAIGARTWAATWPKLAAVGLVVLIWQIAVWREWRPPYVLPPPADVARRLWEDLGTVELWRAIGYTLRRAVVGFGLSLLIGGLIGIAVTRVRLLRVAIGSMITGLQTMPSIAWFPLAILLFSLSEQAILFVVVLGAAPSIANGIIAGIDNVPPSLYRVGRTLGARGDPALSRRDRAGRDAVDARRPEAGVGLLVAEPHGGRVARDHPRHAVARHPAAVLP